MTREELEREVINKVGGRNKEHAMDLMQDQGLVSDECISLSDVAGRDLLNILTRR